MRMAKIFKSGNSQAVRLPKDFQFQSHEVEIFKRGKMVILREVPKNLSQAFVWFSKFPDDFFAEGRTDSPPQEREDIF